MLPVPKPKFFERKVPFGKAKAEYFDEINFRQSHAHPEAIDRVSYLI